MTAVGCALLLPCATVSAGVVEFYDKDEWLGAVGRFTTIDFTGFPDGTLITDQYADQGVHFTSGTDFIRCCGPTFPNDGAGLDGNEGIELIFDTPQTWIGVDHPGALQISLFSEGELLYEGIFSGGGGVGFFKGLIASVPFDEVLIFDPVFNEVAIDDLHLGVPGPSSMAVLVSFVACAIRRRRRQQG